MGITARLGRLGLGVTRHTEQWRSTPEDDHRGGGGKNDEFEASTGCAKSKQSGAKYRLKQTQRKGTHGASQTRKGTHGARKNTGGYTPVRFTGRAKG